MVWEKRNSKNKCLRTGPSRAMFVTYIACFALFLMLLVRPRGAGGAHSPSWAVSISSPMLSGALDWLCWCKNACVEPDAKEGISQHMPMSPSPPGRNRLFRSKKKISGSIYMKRVAEQAISKYGPDLEDMYSSFRRDLNKKRERSWELTVSQKSDSLQFESYRRVCPTDMGSVEYDQKTVYEDASVNELEEFYRDDTHRATQDGSTESLEILAEDKGSSSIVIYQLVRYPWPLVNREYVYVRRKFQDGDKFYYAMQAVNGKEVLPDEEPDDEFRPRRLCTNVCTTCRNKQRVEDFACVICFSPAKGRDGSNSAAEWRQVGRENFGIRNAMITRAAKLAAAKSLWPFQKRIEEAFRCYTKKPLSAPGKDKSQNNEENHGPPQHKPFGWFLRGIRKSPDQSEGTSKN